MAFVIDSKERFVICGCTRNCAVNLPAVFENIRKITTLVNVIEVVVAYDDSSDATLETLKSMQSWIKTTANVALTILVNDKPLDSSRIQNISNARNSLLDYLSKMEVPPDFFIMMDMDDVCSKEISLSTLEAALLKRNEWDNISFNNARYYDFWALSIDKYTYSCWHWTKPREMIRRMNHHLQRKFELAAKHNYSMITCDSAFNGFGIYKYSIYGSLRYNPNMDMSLFNMKDIADISIKTGNMPISGDSNHDTEHRYFQLKAKKQFGARNMIWCQHLFAPYNGSHAAFLYA